MTEFKQLQFFATPEHPCSYLPDRQARTLFVDPSAVVDQAEYTALSQLGFRRSGPHLYRPHCQGCNACLSARVDVRNFRPRRSQRRILKRNGDLTLEYRAPYRNAEIFDLYQRYIAHRHADGDMYPATEEQFDSFLVDGQHNSRFMLFRQQRRLLAVAAVDQLDDGLSAIYTFFEPHQPQRSLGTHVILSQIEEARASGFPYLYLGYWVQGCRKMAYKTRFHPVEILLHGQWRALGPQPRA